MALQKDCIIIEISVMFLRVYPVIDVVSEKYYCA